MVEVEKVCKKFLFIINLGRIKQITRDKCSSKGGGGLQPLDPSLGSASGPPSTATQFVLVETTMDHSAQWPPSTTIHFV